MKKKNVTHRSTFFSFFFLVTNFFFSIFLESPNCPLAISRVVNCAGAPPALIPNFGENAVCEPEHVIQYLNLPLEDSVEEATMTHELLIRTARQIEHSSRANPRPCSCGAGRCATRRLLVPSSVPPFASPWPQLPLRPASPSERASLVLPLSAQQPAFCPAQLAASARAVSYKLCPC